MKIDSKNILITGGAGFIGSNLALHLKKKYPNCSVLIFDKFRGSQKFKNGNETSLGHYKNIKDFNDDVYCGDIISTSDLNFLRDSYNFDIIFHLAAISDTTASEQDLIIKNNLNSFNDIINLALKHRSKLIYASSAATYGASETVQKVGNENPLNVYGYTKLMMDNLAKKYYNRLNIVGLRFFNVYGKNEFFKGKTASTILQFGLQILLGKNPKLFKGSDKIFRDFIYIDDVIQCCILAAKYDSSGIYNVGTGKSRSFLEVCQILSKNLNSDLQPLYIDNPYEKQYQFFTQADITNTIKDLGFNPIFNLEKGIQDYISEIQTIYKNEY